MSVTNHLHVTIRDVATKAGVSHQTVSRVINDNERVSPETRARVLAAIDELSYRPNAIARFMARGRTHTLACLSPNLTDYTFASIIEGAEVEARQNGYFLLSASANDEDTFALLVEQLIESRRTDGLMVINPYTDQRFRHVPKNVPLVYLGAWPRDEQVNSISLDDEGAGYAACQHLLSLDHRRIVSITGPTCEDCSQDRQNGYLQALRQASIAPDPDLVVEGDWSATSGYTAVRSLLERGVAFSAIFAQNDRMAVGAIQALREANLRIPQDVSIIGFDDMPLASYFDPPLTTMRQDTFQLGRQAAQLLLNAVENLALETQQLLLPAELMVRSSTAPYVERR